MGFVLRCSVLLDFCPLLFLVSELGQDVHRMLRLLDPIFLLWAMYVYSRLIMHFYQLSF